MAQYTLELRQITENNVDIFAGWTYPIFDETYRAVLNEKIIRHFYFREIGVETVGKFLYNLQTRMNEIMPSMNKFYTSEKLDQRILDNYDITETMIRNTTSTDKKLFSDVPQGRVSLTGTDYVSEINDDSGSGSENWTRTMIGNIGVQTDADAVLKYRQSILNVDQKVFEELNDLFMGVF